MANELLKMTNVSGKSGNFRLSEINMTIAPGFIYGLMGENGAGKTTLMRYIVDDKCRYSGEITLEGEKLHANHARLMNNIGYVSEDRSFFEGLSCDNLVRVSSVLYDNFDKNIFYETIQNFDIRTSKKYGELSRGEKLKFQLAFEMAHLPKLYVLDEVTAGMDPVFRKEYFAILHRILKNENVAILMTSHIESEMKKHVDYVGIMANGRFDGFKESIEMFEE